METAAQKKLLLVTLLFWFAMYTYVPILAPYAQSLGASYDMTGMIIGGIAGSAIAETAATASILVPELEKEKYPRYNSFSRAFCGLDLLV